MQIGDVLNQRYTLTASLGSGAMAEVFQATDSQTNQMVAVKVLDRKLTLDAELVERFKREGEALRQLRHRHVVSFVDTFQHEGQQVIVMECVSGGSLHQLIKRGPLPMEQTRQIAIDLCDALTTAHRLNIIHRDVKPENVLMAQDGTPRLTDFGVARLVSEGTRLTGTGTQIGTPYYMSPEAWQGQPLDARADIWSLGILLYEMLTGDVPFGGDTLIAVMNKVLTAPLPDLKKLRPDTPAALVKIVRRMLERDKAKRYQSLREVVLDLEHVTATPAPMPIVTSTPQPLAPRTQVVPKTKGGLPRWAPVRGGLVLVVVVCLLAAGGGALAMKMFGQVTAIAQATATAHAPDTVVPPKATYTPVPPADTPIPGSATAPPMAINTVALLSPAAGPGNTTPLPAGTLGVGSTQVSPADGMVQVYVPAGNFLMGATDAEIAQALQTCSGCNLNDEKPQHTVYLDAYWVDKTEVTNAMFAKFAAATRYKTTAEQSGLGTIWAKTFTAAPGASWQHPHGPSSDLRGLDNHPVVQVSWYDASAYCKWAGQQLPTEAQWEKAARGTDGRKYPWGNQAPSSSLLNLNTGGTTDVDKYPAGSSPYGALDMAANVWQWVADWYSETYYASSPAQNPVGPTAGKNRVFRGGFWAFGDRWYRAADRDWDVPDTRYDIGGFRCAATPGK